MLPRTNLVFKDGKILRRKFEKLWTPGECGILPTWNGEFIVFRAVGPEYRRERLFAFYKSGRLWDDAKDGGGFYLGPTGVEGVEVARCPTKKAAKAALRLVSL